VVGCVAVDRQQLVHTVLLIRSLGWYDEVWAPAGESLCYFPINNFTGRSGRAPTL
jgi:hypothetical protein